MSRANSDNKIPSGNKVIFRIHVCILVLLGLWVFVLVFFSSFSSFRKFWISSKARMQFTVIQYCILLYVLRQHYSIILSTNLS